jgi:hypothetical protein
LVSSWERFLTALFLCPSPAGALVAMVPPFQENVWRTDFVHRKQNANRGANSVETGDGARACGTIGPASRCAGPEKSHGWKAWRNLLNLKVVLEALRFRLTGR